MSNRQVWPASLFPLRGDISAEAGATSVIVQGIQGIPVVAPPIEPAGLDTFFYDSYNNDWFYASPWDIPVGIPLVWEGYGYGSSGISWIAPDTLAFGNGTDGDVSGAAAMTALVLFGSASYYGPYDDYDPSYGPSYDQFYTSIFSGATQNWNLILPPNPGTSGQVLTTNGTGVTYWSTIFVPPTTTPGGSNGDIQYNNAGTFGGSLTTITAAGSITLPDTQTIQWTGSAYSSVGLSQLAADTLAVGNGTESDVSGAMAMTAIILYHGSSSTSNTTIYSGATQNWNLVLPGTAGTNGQVLVNIGSGSTAWESVSALGVPWSALTNASANLTLANGTFTTTFNQTSNAAWLWANTSTGTSGSTNASPLHELAANYYTGSASAQDLWTIGSVLAAGTNGTSKLTFTHSGTTGTASVDFPGNLTFANAATVTFNSTNNGTNYDFQSQGNTTVQIRATTSVGAAIIEGNGNGAGGYLALIGNITSQTTGNPGVALGNQSSMTAASGSMVGVNIGGNTNAALTFNPASGSASITGLLIAPTIEGTTSGNTTALLVNPAYTLTGLTGTNLLLDLQSSSVSKLSVNTSGVVTRVAGNATTKQGISSTLNTSIKTAQAAAQSGTSLVTTTPSAGMWRISFVATITTAASAAAVLGGATGFTITYVNGNGDSVTKTTALSTPLGIGATNSTGDSASGDLYCYASSASAITYSYGYTAGTGTAMQYDIAVYAEFLG